MSLDELRKDWQQNSGEVKSAFDNESLRKIFKARVSKQMREPFRYFWASFVMQILLYAFMSHLIVKNWGNASVQIYSLICILLYIPFTWVLLKRFRQMAAGKVNADDSVIDSLTFKAAQLRSFFSFKKRYEAVQIPLCCALGVILPFELFMPGGAMSYVNVMLVWFVVGLVVCFFAIRDENERRFKRPLRELDAMIGELRAA